MTPRKKAEPKVDLTPKGADAPEEPQETVQVPAEPGETPEDGDGHKNVSETDLRGPGHQPEHKPEDMPPLTVTPERGDVAQQRSDEAQQHPALRGKPEVEVAKRSADGSDGMRYVKQFIIKAVGDFDSWIQDEEAHVGHKLRTLEEALQRGLHAKGEVSFDGVEDHGDGVSKVLSYSVETVPAVVDSKPTTTHTVSHNETTGDCPTRDELHAPQSDTK
jgi:hypothetical protein